MKINAFFICLFIVLFAADGKGQGTLDKVIAPLEKWADLYPQEKIHVHLDKPYYLAGDTIWFKIYTVIGGRNQLSGISGAVYVDLLTETDSLVSTLKLPLMAGMAKGSIDLDKELLPGNYRIRSYTQWMRNAGPEYFFDHSFLLGTLSAGLTRSTASFSFLQEKKNMMLKTKISYRDEAGRPLPDKTVSYEYRSYEELLSRGKAITDASGDISLSLKAPDGADSLKTYIISKIEAAPKIWENHTFSVKSTYAAADVQFFPEGGNLVNGLKSRVAFKSIGVDGLGVEITGTITDQDKNEITTFQNMHAGMGVFYLTPEAGKSYQAEVTFPDGQKQTVGLPEALGSGQILAVYPQAGKDTLLVQIMSTPDHFKPASLLVHNHGEVLYAADFKPARTLTSLRVPTANFPAGISQFVLFNETKLPVGQRLAFIEKTDTVQLDVTTDKQSYDLRSPVQLSLGALDTNGSPVPGNFSISVTNESKVPVDEIAENTIYGQLLLRSELKGYVEKPNYYFKDVNNDRRDHLDALLMTQGYARFKWSELLQDSLPEPKYQAEKLTSAISGRLLNLFGKPIENGKIILMSLAARLHLDTTTNSDGRFTFGNLLMTKGLKLTVQGTTAKNSNKAELLLDVVPGMPIMPSKNTGDLILNPGKILEAYTSSALEQDKAFAASGLSSRIIQLDEVSVTARRNKANPPKRNLNTFGRADQVVTANELTACATLRMCLEGRLRGVRFTTIQTSVGRVSIPESTRGGRMMIVIDSRVLSYNNDSDLLDIAGVFDQNMIDPGEILSIEVLRSPALIAVYGSGSTAGVIQINTKGWTPGERTVFNVKNFTPQGYTFVREFYSPKYGVSELADIKADFRTTVYWNPAISNSTEGKATVDFFNAGQAGTYRVVVEGVGGGGQLMRKVTSYTVQ